MRRRLTLLCKWVGLLKRSLGLIHSAAPATAVATCTVVLIQGALPALTVVLGARLVDSLALQQAESMLWMAVAWLGTMMIGSMLNPLGLALQGTLTEKLTAQVNLTIMRKTASFVGLEELEDPSFHDRAEIIRRESSWRPINLLVYTLGNVRNATSTLAMLLVLGSVHPVVPVLIAFATLPQAYASFRLQQNAFEAMMDASPDSRRMRYYRDVMLNEHHAKEIRVYGLASFFQQRFEAAFSAIHTAMNRARWNQARWCTVWVAVKMAATGVGLGWVVRGAGRGEYSVGTILLFAQASFQANQSLVSLVEESTMLYDTLLYMEKLFDFADQAERRPARAGPLNRVSAPMGTGVEFRDVSFSYRKPERVLDGVTFSMRPGEVVALVGENGAGKTTVAKLLAGLYTPDSGEILLDGYRLDDYDMQSWRDSIAVVFQDFARLCLTAGENIALGDLAADPGLVQRAASLSGADSFIERLPQRYDTLLGRSFEGGVDISGGQWQQIGLARAYMRQSAQVLILDEPSAALDVQTEADLLERFRQIAGGRAVLLISHRLSAVSIADRILVLEDGKVSEMGTHKALLEQRGSYARLFTLQASKYFDSEGV